MSVFSCLLLPLRRWFVDREYQTVLLDLAVAREREQELETLLGQRPSWGQRCVLQDDLVRLRERMVDMEDELRYVNSRRDELDKGS